MTARRSPAIVDLPRPLPYIAASAEPRQSRWNGCREAHLPAQQARPQAPPWLPCAHGHAGRPPGAGVAPCEGPQAPVCLSFFGCTLGARAKLARPARSMTADLARLKNRADFLRVAAGRRRAVRPAFIVQAAPRPTKDASGTSVRVGFTASRKVGNAVVRNRAKRRLRAIAAEILPQMGHPGTDYVLVARATANERPYAELLGDLEGALRQLARQTERGGSSERARAAVET